MSNRFLDLASPGVQGLHPYQPGKPIEELEREYGVSNIVKLASNENPLGTSPLALQAIADACSGLALYPDPNGFTLKQALAARHGVGLDQITLGNGSNDVLVLLAEAFLTPERGSVFSEYCFAVYPIATQAAGAKAQVAAASEGLGHDLAAMSAAIDDSTAIIFIANPNNPTGTQLAPDALKDFIASVPREIIVVVDEAYVEYQAPETPTADQWLDEFPNLVVTRTFSKAYGLAGLRVGYALSHPDVADLLNRVRQPFNVNTLALAAAEAALGDTEFLERTRVVNNTGLAQLYQGLDRLGRSYVTSAGNFVLFDLGTEAGPVFESLLRQGVIARPVANYGLPRHLRVSVGTEEENEKFLQALAHALS